MPLEKAFDGSDVLLQEALYFIGAGVRHLRHHNGRPHHNSHGHLQRVQREGWEAGEQVV